jgi:lysozyme
VKRIVPASRPRLARKEIQEYLIAGGVPLKKTALLGLRGYYQDTLGKPGVNDRGLYDDAICLWSERGSWNFNANTDPSVYRRGIAVLKPGLWYYRRGLHRRKYPALVQDSEVTVIRDGGVIESGYFGINIHRGGEENTWSLGCQTIYSPQYNQFIQTVGKEMIFYQIEKISYLLFDLTNLEWS